MDVEFILGVLLNHCPLLPSCMELVQYVRIVLTFSTHFRQLRFFRSLPVTAMGHDGAVSFNARRIDASCRIQI